MSNATQIDSPEQSPERVNCPTWCVRDARLDEGTPDEMLVHNGAVREAGGFTVHLQRLDDREGQGETVEIFLDDTEMSLEGATALTAALSATTTEALSAMADTQTAFMGPTERQDEHATVVCRRPSWAEKTTMGAEVITHSWTAPTVAMVSEPGSESLSRAPVELYREDDLLVHDDVVALHEGPWRIFLLETAIEDVTNARRLAAGIIECCDRIEAADDAL